MNKNIAVRCISENSKGYGNFSRAFTLASNLKKRGYSVTFIINSNKFLEFILTKEKFNFSLIPKKFNFKNENIFLLDYFKKNRIELLILDMREYGEILSKQLFKIIPTILIDDAFCKNIYSDIVINGSINKKFQKYNVKNKNTDLFLGPKFFMANEYFLKNKKLQKNITIKKKYVILVSIGGSDPHHLTSYIIKSIMHLSNIKIIIIVGPFFENIFEIKNLIKNKKNISIIFSPKKIWNEFKKADIVISKSGITLYELAIMGIPTLCISSFKHEEPSAKKFMTEKVLINLGMQKSVTKHYIESQLVKLLDNVKKRREMSKHGKIIVDGKGLLRVTNIIESFLLKLNF